MIFKSLQWINQWGGVALSRKLECFSQSHFILSSYRDTRKTLNKSWWVTLTGEDSLRLVLFVVVETLYTFVKTQPSSGWTNLVSQFPAIYPLPASTSNHKYRHRDWIWSKKVHTAHRLHRKYFSAVKYIKCPHTTNQFHFCQGKTLPAYYLPSLRLRFKVTHRTPSSTSSI